jgi:serine/threonine protein kinase
LTKDPIHVLKDGETIADRYTLGKVLQEDGLGCRTLECRRVSSDGSLNSEGDFTMKIKSKDSFSCGSLVIKARPRSEERFRKAQVKVMDLPPHPGVLPIHQVLEDDRFYYIVTARATGGAFFQSLLAEFEDGVMPEAAVQTLVRQILQAVEYVHSHKMLHRDIKPDNLVIHDTPDGLGGVVRSVALTGFDHADPEWDPKITGWDAECFGTVAFNAPEALLGQYSEASDLYSVGVILYLLMSGQMPYDDDVYAECESNAFSRRALNHRMKDAAIDWECFPWTRQPECADLCKALLAFNPQDRSGSAGAALRHCWLADNASS